MTRIEIRRRALRAAAAVSFTMSVLGCTGTVVDDAEDPAEDPAHETEPGVDPVPAEPAPAAEPSAVVAPEALDEAVVGPGVATEDCSPLQEADYEAWLACCDANNWDWNKGCQAWGPPVPPSMERV